MTGAVLQQTKLDRTYFDAFSDKTHQVGQAVKHAYNVAYAHAANGLSKVHEFVVEKALPALGRGKDAVVNHGKRVVDFISTHKEMALAVLLTAAASITLAFVVQKVFAKPVVPTTDAATAAKAVAHLALKVSNEKSAASDLASMKATDAEKAHTLAGEIVYKAQIAYTSAEANLVAVKADSAKAQDEVTTTSEALDKANVALTNATTAADAAAKAAADAAEALNKAPADEATKAAKTAADKANTDAQAAKVAAQAAADGAKVAADAADAKRIQAMNAVVTANQALTDADNANTKASADHTTAKNAEAVAKTAANAAKAIADAAKAVANAAVEAARAYPAIVVSGKQ